MWQLAGCLYQPGTRKLKFLFILVQPSRRIAASARYASSFLAAAFFPTTRNNRPAMAVDACLILRPQTNRLSMPARRCASRNGVR